VRKLAYILFAVGGGLFILLSFSQNVLAVQKVIIITSTTSSTWTVPTDWNSNSNTIEVIGGGGNGVGTSGSTGAGGAGGGYSKISNLTLTPDGSVNIRVGPTASSTWFNGTTCAGSSVCANGGGSASGATAGTATTTGAVGTVQYKGGDGLSGGGGGGAASSNGAGGDGTGGSGGNGGPSGSGLAGGGGGNSCANGANGTEWGSAGAGSGSGGGGKSGGPSGAGCAGGMYGAGGGTGYKDTTPQGGQPGIIVITYTSTPTVTAINPSTATNTAPASITSVTGTNFDLGWDKENGLVGSWRMDEGSGTNVADSSGNNNTGTANGTTIVAGKINNGRNFNGTSDIITVPNSSSLDMTGSAFTIAVWAKGSAPGLAKYLVGKTDGASCGYALYTGSSGNAKVYFCQSSSGCTISSDSGTPLWDNTWHYLTGVYDGSFLYLYVDAGLRTTTAASGAITGSSTVNLAIGDYNSVGGYKFPGSIDEVRIYNRALSAVEVYQLYSATADPYVKLTKTGQSDIIASSTNAFTLNSSTTLASGTFPITGAATGAWNVVVTNPDGQTGTLSNGFTVNAAGGGGGSPAILTQRSWILQNDNGPNPDSNTQRLTGIAYPVEKGERFIVRFQVDNTGTSATTAQFAVQYDRNDGVWNSVTSGEISQSPGIYGSTGDAISNITCAGGLSPVNGKWQENTATTASVTLNINECSEYAFALSTATSVPRTTYRFRLVNGTNGNQVLNYSAYPSIVLVTFQEKNYSKSGIGAELASLPTAADDLAYYLDATGYSAIASDDGIYDTATSSNGSNTPVSLFKIRSPYLNNANSFTVKWNGQSSVAPSAKAVTFELWDNTHSAWITASSNSFFTSANTDFSFNTATSGTLFYDSNSFVYVRVSQAAGIEELRTDLISIHFGPPPGPQVDRKDILSDSRPGAGANHTVSFAINSGFDASEYLDLDWPSSYAFPPEIDCGDVDVATGTQFTLSTTSSGCVATANTWGALFMSDTRVFRLTAPSNAGIYVATGTTMTITIGLNASSQQSGNSRIVNPSAVGSYSLDVAGPVGTGRMMVAIYAGFDVSAQIADSLSLSVSSISAGVCTADDGASITAKDTTATAVPFGTINANTFYQACQDLSVATNAVAGYSLSVQESSAMKTASGQYVIPDTTCDAGGCSEITAAAWTNPAKSGFGHTCFNQFMHDCASAYSNGTLFRQFANMSVGETVQTIMASSTPAIATGRVKYRLSAPTNQATGTYTNLITYTILGTF
jgi:hypothetical protein